MFFEILTIFPSMFKGPFNDSIIKRAVDKKLVSINVRDIREYSQDRHKSVDDYPYGGGAGMVMQPQPLADAVKAAREKWNRPETPVIFMTPHGRTFNQETASELSGKEGMIIICGRYKGIDNRIRMKYVDYEISIGDYILSGGEIPAMVLVDGVIRLIPGVLGNSESIREDSFYDGILSPPHYTRPEVFEGSKVPDVLLSGNHGEIARWRKMRAEEETNRRRIDLMPDSENRDRPEIE